MRWKFVFLLFVLSLVWLLNHLCMIISTAGIFDTTLTETLPKEKSHFYCQYFFPLRDCCTWKIHLCWAPTICPTLEAQIWTHISRSDTHVKQTARLHIRSRKIASSANPLRNIRRPSPNLSFPWSCRLSAATTSLHPNEHSRYAAQIDVCSQVSKGEKIIFLRRSKGSRRKELDGLGISTQ